MISRFHMKRGATVAQLPKGRRFDTRKHTKHVLRPPAKLVEEFISGEVTFAAFRKAYRAELEKRWKSDRAAFDALVGLARDEDVYLGCSCPSAVNPDVTHCHTWLALEYLREKYPDLDVVFPT